MQVRPLTFTSITIQLQVLANCSSDWRSLPYLHSCRYEMGSVLTNLRGRSTLKSLHWSLQSRHGLGKAPCTDKPEMSWCCRFKFVIL